MNKPIKEEWFGIVRWCEEDLKVALENRGLPATEENIAKLRNRLDDHWFTDHMIEAGWDYIYSCITDNDVWEE